MVCCGCTRNFCLPTLRLRSKIREQGRIKRVYDKPCTPYERVMGSPQIDRRTKQQLRSTYPALNPAALYRRLTELREQLEAISAGRSEGYGKPAYRGPDIRISKRRNPATAVA
jgi:hypothetical protein